MSHFVFLNWLRLLSIERIDELFIRQQKILITYNQRIKIRCYNISRSFGTITLRNGAVVPDYFVRLDLVLFYSKTE
jgi:hypothetical protein